jgi:ketosteroid isomerase-like protein
MKFDISTAVWTLASAVLAAASLSASAARTAACPRADSAAVSGAMQAMLNALAAQDLKTTRTYLAPDFYAFDGGTRFDAGGLLALVGEKQRSGSTFRWTVAAPQVRFACDIAWITYVNRGRITDAGHETPVTWLESGVLRREAGRWVIQFLHSTRAATPTP